MILAFCAATTAFAFSQTTPTVTEHSATNVAAAAPLTAEQLIPMTIREAWTASGKDEAKFFDMVKVLAQYSSQKRGVTLPDTHADNVKLGEYIKAHAKTDTDQLLYVVVDEAVRHISSAASAQ